MSLRPFCVRYGACWSVALGLLLTVTMGAAKDISVHTPRELQSALAAAEPGDAIILSRGTWRDVPLKITRGGTAEQPLMVRAEVPGQTLLTGSSHLEFAAPHVVVEGLFFYHGAVKDGSVVQFNSHHGVLRETAIVDYNPAEFTTRYYWVFFNGDSNSVERCYFKGKNNLEPLIGNAVEASQHNRVVESYFRNIPWADGNGREIIRVWGAGKFDATDGGGAYFTIERNLFEHADGEGVEIISLKSNYNRVLANTVVATRGGLNIRQGSHNEVRGNIILGQGLKGAQGLRMSGRHNVVAGNLVSGAEFGIRISTGEYIESALTPNYVPNMKPGARKNGAARIATYPQVRELTLEDNVVIGSAGADLEIGFFYKRHWPESQMVLLPEDCEIRRNRFVRLHGGVSVVGVSPETAPPLDRFKFIPNRYSDNRLIGGRNDYAPAASGCLEESLPADWSEAKQLTAWSPLTAKDVGPAWVIARRAQGDFPMEDDKSCERTGAPPSSHSQ